jgi:NAD(P)-dependent dehydrogenase (short-subunit alcohol dehydrogenase family)
VIETSQTLLQFIPFGRVGEPDEIAKCALFLLSDLAAYVSGHTVVVDGGTLVENVLSNLNAHGTLVARS